MDLALWLLPVAITCCRESATGQLAIIGIIIGMTPIPAAENSPL